MHVTDEAPSSSVCQNHHTGASEPQLMQDVQRRFRIDVEVVGAMRKVSRQREIVRIGGFIAQRDSGAMRVL